MSGREVRRRVARAGVVAAVAAIAAGARAASADPTSAHAPDPKVVELYREARELVNAGKWDEACPKFDQAMAMQPTASILVNVGDCHEHAGKLAQALEDYAIARELNRETREESRRTAIAAEIDTRVKKLAPRVPRLRVVVEKPVAGTVVRRNGEPVREDALGTELRVDPGTHDITAEAPGHTAAPQRVVLKEGDSQRVTVRLEASSFAAQHTASIVLAGAAVALAGAGAGLAGWTVATHGSLPEACGARDQAECAARKDTLAIGALATNVAFAAAGAAAATAVLVFVVAERPKSPKVQAAIAGPFASVRVAW